ncbi:MAG: ATP-binding protein [Polyangiaceae bacterium]
MVPGGNGEANQSPLSASETQSPGLREWLTDKLGRIWLRLLLINVTVVLVPVAGLEFARIYERQLLSALERDMNDQAALTRALLEEDLRHSIELGDARHRAILETAAKRTRTRVRILDAQGAVLIDSHRDGPPEGPEPEPPHWVDVSTRESGYRALRSGAKTTWPDIPERSEVVAARNGKDAAQTRLAHRPQAVFLFATTPVKSPAKPDEVAGVVYVTRSTRPVLVELYRIRAGLFKVLTIALVLSTGITLLLAFSISRPLSRLSRAAKRIAAGERGVALPVGGSGEIRELSHSFRTMTEELDSRLNYISEFAADVAHEFKSPLTSIRGAAELLAEGAHEDPDARERFLNNILLDTERLDRLVSRLLLLSRIESRVEGMTLVDLHSLLERVCKRLGAHDAEDSRKLELHFQAHHTWVRGREEDLETAFTNLIENAQRYSPKDKPVLVTAHEFPRGIVVSVADQGPGVPEARRDKIFERFYTTEAEQGGTGLGLAIVDTVARAHGGKVTLESEVGQGARFSVWLPRDRRVHLAR